MARSLSIVVGITSRSWGGNEKWAAEAARGLAERGHRVVVLWTYDPVGRELAARYLRARRVRLWGDLNPFGFASLVAALRSERPDALILTKQREYWMGGLAARRAGKPFVAFRLGLRRRLPDDFKRRTAFGKLADLVIVNSTAVRDTLLESPWVDPSKVMILLNAVSSEVVDREAGRDSLRELGLPAGTPVICGAGRLTRQKGFDVLIESLAIVRDSIPGARLLLLGEGGQRRALEGEARARGLADAVVFAGHRRDVRAILSAVDVYALSSRNEGMANTLLEAMSVGAPIVATDVSGTAEAVSDGVAALIVPPEDPRALADALVRVLGDVTLAAGLGRAARERAAIQFGRERMLDELEAALVSGAVRKKRATCRRTP
jgi:glycosyltransferase involved in cell wall biosynthesis